MRVYQAVQKGVACDNYVVIINYICINTNNTGGKKKFAR